MASHPVSVARAWPPRFSAVRRPWAGLPGVARRRRALTWALGVLWLLDAALQYQPFMFTRAFPDQVIRPAAAGNPAWVGAPVRWAAGLLAEHVIAFNALFATMQLAIALGLLVTATVRLALAASIIWALLVWWLGEGLGGTLAGPQSPLMGLPGAVILYAVIALLVWPPRPGSTVSPTERDSVARHGLLGAAAARTVWVLLWAGFAFEALRPAERAPSALHDMIAGMAAGEPGWLTDLDNQAARVVAQHGAGSAVGLALVCLVVAASVLIPALTRVGLVLAVLLALTIWLVGEDLGQIATGAATDPNTGLPLILLALCYWPPGSRSPARSRPI